MFNTIVMLEECQHVHSTTEIFTPLTFYAYPMVWSLWGPNSLAGGIMRHSRMIVLEPVAILCDNSQVGDVVEYLT